MILKKIIAFTTSSPTAE